MGLLAIVWRLLPAFVSVHLIMSSACQESTDGLPPGSAGRGVIPARGAIVKTCRSRSLGLDREQRGAGRGHPVHAAWPEIQVWLTRVAGTKGSPSHMARSAGSPGCRPPDAGACRDAVALTVAARTASWRVSA